MITDTTTPTRPKMLTIADVAQELGVGHRTVRREIDAGNLKASRVRGALRVSRRNFDRYLEKIGA
ncbi:MAG: helix-turn-helix domain-containing protein [Bifidobacteriaceae bacterium]|jgi:excisionase family DNA binding protein|nr:helix-turn-helix domain-containing protein [Bifidobacteriaceae bacterium]